MVGRFVRPSEPPTSVVEEAGNLPAGPTTVVGCSAVRPEGSTTVVEEDEKFSCGPARVVGRVTMLRTGPARLVERNGGFRTPPTSVVEAARLGTARWQRLSQHCMSAVSHATTPARWTYSYPPHERHHPIHPQMQQPGQQLQCLLAQARPALCQTMDHAGTHTQGVAHDRGVMGGKGAGTLLHLAPKLAAQTRAPRHFRQGQSLPGAQETEHAGELPVVRLHIQRPGPTPSARR